MDNLLTQWARLTMLSLADAGVEHVVVSPGSRSTPFLVAACAEARLRCHSVIDERAAGFFALGLAKVTSRPVALLCTSGSAGAHYYPAVVEADVAGIPLVVLTADRPLELQQCGAPQTIDQVKLFGDRVRGYFESGQPDASPGALRGLRRIVHHAVALASVASARGPVQVNVRARKPLEPAHATTEAERALEREVDTLARSPKRIDLGVDVVPASTLDDVAALARSHGRGLLRCGPVACLDGALVRALHGLARATGYLFHAETGSGARHAAREGVRAVDTFPLLDAAGLGEPPTFVLHVGGTSLFGPPRGVEPATVVTLASHGVVDPENDAHFVLRGDVGRALEDLATRFDRPVVDEAWAERAVARDALVRETLRALDDVGDAPLREGVVARALGRALPAGALLVLGNSLPIRSYDLYCHAGGVAYDVVVQRGANGIDGHVALSAGIAEASGRPVALHLGDVSLLHDLTSLVVARRARTPLVVLVVQNGGGRIFEQLPLAGHPLLPEGAWELVTTPTEIDLGAVCGGFGVAYAACRSLAALDAALAEAFARPGVMVVEAFTSPSAAREEQRDVRALLTRKLAASAG